MSYVIIALAILLGSAIVGATFAYFIRARRVEAGGGPQSNIASAAAPVPVAKEVEAIGEQIEKAMADHRFQGETQRQLIAQKLETVRHSVEAQKNQVQGLRSEFLHESRRRDHEIASIRTQIGTIQETVGLPATTHQALPPASPAPAPTPEPEDDSLSFPLPDPSLASADEAAFPVVQDEASLPDSAFEDIVFAEGPRTEPAPPAAPTFEDATFSEETFSAPDHAGVSAHEPELIEPSESAPSDDTFQETTFAAPSPVEATPFDDTFAEATFADVSVDATDAPVTLDAGDLDIPFPAAVHPTPDEAALEETFAETTFAETTFAPPPPLDAQASEPVTDTPFPLASSQPAAEVTDEPPHAPVDEAPTPFTPPPALEEDPFATAPLYDEPIGGDSAADLGDVFEAWSPDASAPAPAPETPASAETDEESVAVDTPPAFDTKDAAWISRPQVSLEPLDLEQASPDEFFDMPVPAARPAPAAAEQRLVDLDALMATPDAAPKPPPAPEPVWVEPVTESAPEPAVEATPEPAAGPISLPDPDVEAAPEPTPEPVTQSVPEPIVEAVPEPLPELRVAPFSAPEIETPAVPTLQNQSESIVEPEPVAETAHEPVAMPEPETGAVPPAPYEPVVETMPDPVVEATPEPVVEIAPTPFAEAPREPAVETAPEPEAHHAEAPVAEPIAATVPEPVAPDPVVPEVVAPEPSPGPAPTVPEPAPAPEAVSAPEPADETGSGFEIPEGAEDLTVIATVDEHVQRLLYLAGVRTLEEIAQWGRGEARRIGSQVEVSEDTIMNQWVFEAQAALFNRYSQQAGG